jgi:hypothetical protein
MPQDRDAKGGQATSSGVGMYPSGEPKKVRDAADAKSKGGK